MAFGIDTGLLLHDMNVIGHELFSSSYLNHNNPSLALDGDNTTCYRSGAGEAHWWKMKLDNPMEIKGVRMAGYWPDLVQVRIGPYHDDLGDRSGHGPNKPCCRYNLEGLQTGLDMPCTFPIFGSVLSLGSSFNHYQNNGTLEICELDIYV